MTNQVLYVLFACFLAGAAAIAVLYVRLLFGKRDAFAVCSVALAEVGVKARIKKILTYEIPTHWVIVACLLLCAILAVFFLTNPKSDETPSGESTENSETTETLPMGTPLGEGYYLYGEYETELTFAEVSEQLETLGYSVKFVDSAPEMTFEGERVCGAFKETHRDKPYHVCMYILSCDTVELAKDVYTYWMVSPSGRYDHPLACEPFFYAQSVVRIGDTVYAIMDRDEVLKDLLSVFDIPLPDPTPLYSGDAVVANFVMEYDEVIRNAEKAGYTVYTSGELHHEAFLEHKRLVSPQHNAYFFLIRVKDSGAALSDEVARLYYQMFNPIGELEIPSMKLIILSDDTFVLGSSAFVDAFVERLQNGAPLDESEPEESSEPEDFVVYYRNPYKEREHKRCDGTVDIPTFVIPTFDKHPYDDPKDFVNKWLPDLPHYP